MRTKALFRRSFSVLQNRRILLDLSIFHQNAKLIFAVYITAPSPQYIGTKLRINDIADILSLTANQISTLHPIDLIDAGLRTLIVPILNFNDEINIFPLEDPATGSGNSAFGYYMLKNNIWDGKPISIEQGGTDRIFNRGAESYRIRCPVRDKMLVENEIIPHTAVPLGTECDCL